jgi:hypothetical protein
MGRSEERREGVWKSYSPYVTCGVIGPVEIKERGFLVEEENRLKARDCTAEYKQESDRKA